MSLITCLRDSNPIFHPIPHETHVNIFKVMVPKAVLHLCRWDAAQPVASLVLLHLICYLNRCIEKTFSSWERLYQGSLCELDILRSEVELVFYLEVLISDSEWESKALGECSWFNTHLVALRGDLLKLSLTSFRLMRLGRAALLNAVLELVDLCFFLWNLWDVGMADVFGMGFLLVHELDLFFELWATVTNLLLQRGYDCIFLGNSLLMWVYSLLHAFCVSSAL